MFVFCSLFVLACFWWRNVKKVDDDDDGVGCPPKEVYKKLRGWGRRWWHALRKHSHNIKDWLKKKYTIKHTTHNTQLRMDDSFWADGLKRQATVCCGVQFHLTAPVPSVWLRHRTCPLLLCCGKQMQRENEPSERQRDGQYYFTICGKQNKHLTA